MTTGNEARFVNDKWQHPSGEHNVGADIIWDDEKKVPVVAFIAENSIEEVRGPSFPVPQPVPSHFGQGEELLIDYGADFWKIIYCTIMKGHVETYRRMVPWCGKMKQLIEEHGVDEPPKPDFTRSLPPFLMDTMDVGVGSQGAESAGERFRVPHTVLHGCCYRLPSPLNFQFMIIMLHRATHPPPPPPLLQRFDDTSDDEAKEE